MIGAPCLHLDNHAGPSFADSLAHPFSFIAGLAQFYVNPVESTPSAHPGTLDAKSTKTDGCEEKKESGRQRRAPTSIEEYKSSSLTGCSVGETENCIDFARSANLLLMYFGRDGMWKRRERREMFFIRGNHLLLYLSTAAVTFVIFSSMISWNWTLIG